MKLGIGTYTYMWSIGFPGAEPAAPMTAMDLLEEARQLKVSVVQYGPNLPLRELPHSALAELLAAARQFNIELEIGTRGLGTDHLRRMLEFTTSCNAALLRTVPDVQDNQITNLLSAIEPHCRAAQIRLASENSLVPSASLAAALDATASPWLGITLDTVNSLAIPEGTREVATNLARFTHCLHVKDFVASREWHMMGFQVQGRPAGQGQLNVPWLLDLLTKAGARCNAILELWPPQQPTLADTIQLEQRWAVESISYLRTLITE